MSLIDLIRKNTPKYLLIKLKRILKLPFALYERNLIATIHKKQIKATLALKGKKVIKVAFFVLHDSIWKYEVLFKLLTEDKRFEPVIIVCPYISYGNESMFNELEKTFSFFKQRGYFTLNTYDKEKNTWLDVKKEINPDVVFFTNPHKVTRDEYYITNWQEKLTCYVPYAFVIIHLLDMHYNQLFQQLLWRHFCETTMHERYALSFLKRADDNVIVSGFPGLDELLLSEFKPKAVWKNKNPSLKKIIWAPHHTLTDDKKSLSYSNFIEYADFMLDFVINNADKVQMAFKPHPILKPRLYTHPNWGKEKTEQYYNIWDGLENGQLEEAGYIDLFATSDAMIMDSASFMVEYLYVRKPIMFMMRYEDILDQFNDFGKLVFKQLYKSKNKTEVLDFFNMIIDGKDAMLHDRNQFFQTTILPKNGKLASENIYNELIKELC